MVTSIIEIKQRKQTSNTLTLCRTNDINLKDINQNDIISNDIILNDIISNDIISNDISPDATKS